MIIGRGKWQPGPETIKAPGHVGFFAGWHGLEVSGDLGVMHILGGNQGNTVSTKSFELKPDEEGEGSRLLGIRRLLD